MGNTRKFAVRRRFFRPVVYLGLISVLLLICAVAIQEARSFEAAYQARSQAMLDTSLRQAMERWEGSLEERLGSWMSVLATTDDPAEFEARARKEFPFFDAVYTWDGDELTYPVAAHEEDLAALRESPCIAAATQAPTDGIVVDPVLFPTFACLRLPKVLNCCSTPI